MQQQLQFEEPSVKDDRQLLLDHLRKGQREIPFGQIPTELFMDPNVTDQGARIFGYLHTWCHPKQLIECPKCKVPYGVIESDMKWSKSKVSRHLRELEKSGWLSKKRSWNGGPYEFTLYPKNKQAQRKLKRDLKTMERIKKELAVGKSERVERIRAAVKDSQVNRQYEKYEHPKELIIDIPLDKASFELSPEEQAKISEMRKIWNQKDKDLHAGYIEKKKNGGLYGKKFWC